MARKPNLFIYLADDLSKADMGTYGAKRAKTPFLDQLAAEGIQFENAYVASPSCAPSRAALLTGLWPIRNGAQANHRLPQTDIPLLTQSLRESGYRVIAIGKIAHKQLHDSLSFDYYRHRPVNLTQQVRQYLRQHPSDQPTCLLIGDRRPHVAWTSSPTYDPDSVDLPVNLLDTPETRAHRARYYTDISGLDHEFGQIKAHLDSLWQTPFLTLFSSDHGAQWPFAKWNLYEIGTNVPLLISWPGQIEADQQSDAMLSWIDIMPTILDLVGAKVPTDLSGRSFASVLTGEQDAFRSQIFTTHTGDGPMNVYPMRAVRDQRYKYIRNYLPLHFHTNHSDRLRKDGAGAYWDSWDHLAQSDPQAQRLIQAYYLRPAEELYDLRQDPLEQINLIALPQYQEELGRMRGLLQTWLKEYEDTILLHQEPYPLEAGLPDLR
ncbi:MAG: sulfatase, partial [Bacteroidota bacterium]